MRRLFFVMLWVVIAGDVHPRKIYADKAGSPSPDARPQLKDDAPENVHRYWVRLQQDDQERRSAKATDVDQAKASLATAEKSTASPAEKKQAVVDAKRALSVAQADFAAAGRTMKLGPLPLPKVQAEEIGEIAGFRVGKIIARDTVLADRVNLWVLADSAPVRSKRGTNPAVERRSTQGFPVGPSLTIKSYDHDVIVHTASADLAEGQFVATDGLTWIVGVEKLDDRQLSSFNRFDLKKYLVAPATKPSKPVTSLRTDTAR